MGESLRIGKISQGDAKQRLVPARGKLARDDAVGADVDALQNTRLRTVLIHLTDRRGQGKLGRSSESVVGRNDALRTRAIVPGYWADRGNGAGAGIECAVRVKGKNFARGIDLAQLSGGAAGDFIAVCQDTNIPLIGRGCLAK